MLYKVLDNEVIELQRGLPAFSWAEPVWLDGLGLVGYLICIDCVHGGDWYYGSISLDGKAMKINETVSALEPQDLRYDELRGDALIEAYSSGKTLEFFAANGLYAGENWAEEAEPLGLSSIHIRGRSHLYRRTTGTPGKVQRCNIGDTVWTDVCDVDHPIISANYWAGYNSRFYPRADGNYFICHKNGGTIQAFNPLEGKMFGPVYTLEERDYYHIGYSKEMDVFIAVYATSSYEGRIQVYARETVPDAVSEVGVVGGGTLSADSLTEVEVYVTGDRSEGCEGERVDWSVSTGPGSMQFSQTVTDEDGKAINWFVPDGSFPFTSEITAEVDI